MRVISRIVVAAGLVLTCVAQLRSAEPAAANGGMRILVLQGYGAINYLKSNEAVVPVVSVLDENDRPIEGATVVFQLPSTGPGASFEGGRLSLTTATNIQGQAAASGFRPNGQAGQFTIHVEASWNGAKATASFSQINSIRDPSASAARVSGQANKSSAKWWITGIVLAAGAAGGYFGATHIGGSSAVRAGSVSVQPGPIVVGAP
jgi:hypothetical protein